MKKKNEMITIVLVVIFVVAIMYFSGIGCPILKMTGIPCFGCGMTRACVSLLHFDFAAALYYHPMVFLIPFCIVALLTAPKLPKKAVNGIVTTVIVLFVLVYLVRLFDAENEIVKWNIKEGVLYKFFDKINQLWNISEKQFTMRLRKNYFMR